MRGVIATALALLRACDGLAVADQRGREIAAARIDAGGHHWT